MKTFFKINTAFQTMGNAGLVWGTLLVLVLVFVLESQVPMGKAVTGN
jgi:hypothetical protein